MDFKLGTFTPYVNTNMANISIFYDDVIKIFETPKTKKLILLFLALHLVGGRIQDFFQGVPKNKILNSDTFLKIMSKAI